MSQKIVTRFFTQSVTHLFSSKWTGSSMVEQLTLNQRVVGSSPTRFTKSSNVYAVLSSVELR